MPALKGMPSATDTAFDLIRESALFTDPLKVSVQLRRVSRQRAPPHAYVPSAHLFQHMGPDAVLPRSQALKHCWEIGSMTVPAGHEGRRPAPR